MTHTGSPYIDHGSRQGASAADLRLLRRIADDLLADPVERERFFTSNRQYAEAGLTDFFFATSSGRNGDRACDPNRIFHVLRWGGQFIYCSPNRREAEAGLNRLRQRPEFAIDQDLATITTPRFSRVGLAYAARLLPPLRKAYHFFIARKTLLTQPGVATDRYSYDVRLERRGPSLHDYVVLKQVPTMHDAIERLSLRFPEADPATIENSARKLVDKVFPIFLTREAALLKIVHRELPDEYRDRFPSVLDLVTDKRGLVQRMRLNWLRLGGPTMSQLDFAHQAADLLHVLHDRVGIIHMDLRLDNFVVTPAGVGFVDFGSAVRVGEDFDSSPMLAALFGEMLSTSQVQRDLRRLVSKHKVTSPLFTNCCNKMDKAVDLFYLVLQMNNPHANPEFRGLVHYDRGAADAKALASLSRAVLNPRNTAAPRYRTARDVLQGIDLVRERLAGTGAS